MNTKKLSELPIGECTRVCSLKNVGEIRRRLLDIGLSPGTEVRCVGKSPLGDPLAFLIRGTEIAIRISDAEKIIMYQDTPPSVNTSDVKTSNN